MAHSRTSSAQRGDRRSESRCNPGSGSDGIQISGVQKEYYDMAQELTLEHCYDLNVLAVNQKRMYKFYTQHGIPNGVAWNYVVASSPF